MELIQNIKIIFQENKKYRFFLLFMLLWESYLLLILLTPEADDYDKLNLLFPLPFLAFVTLFILNKRFPPQTSPIEDVVEILTANPELTKELFRQSFKTSISSLALGFIWFYLFAVSIMSCDSGCNDYIGYILGIIGLLYPIFIITSLLMWLFYFFKIKHEKALELVLFTKKYSPIFMLSPIFAVLISFFFR